MFFDEMKWLHEYEPFDLSGWIPDFVLKGKKRNTLVEVKPYTKIEEFYSNGVIDKVLKVNDAREVLFLGCCINDSNCLCGAQLGWLYTPDCCLDFEWPNCGIDDAMLDYNGFFAAAGSFENRITGVHDGDHHLKPVEYLHAKSIFNKAKTKAQWFPKN